MFKFESRPSLFWFLDSIFAIDGNLARGKNAIYAPNRSISPPDDLLIHLYTDRTTI